jgi:NAD-dependent deacetylase
MDAQLLTALNLLRNAHYAIALTGAGISTPSGIPDFRSAGSGLWENAESMQVASIVGFKTQPQRFYDWVRPLVNVILSAEPNAAHLALSRMERSGRLQCVITQNIDLLHTRAGSQHVIEVHGNLREMTCIGCYTVYEAQRFINPFVLDGRAPHCPNCGGVLKPNVILFGEQLPVREIMAAEQAAALCDVMLIAGSSLEVAPVCDLPVKARRHGAALIIVNFDSTPMDSVADAVIHGDVASVLPQLADALEAV